MKNKYLFVAVMLLSILLVSIGFTSIYVSGTNTTEQEDEFVVVTSFYPMYIAAMNVIGDTEGVTLKNLSEPQTGCLHDFQLTPADMKLLSTADVFIINGGGIESFMEDIAKQYPDLVVINASEGLALLGDDEAGDADEAETSERVSMDERETQGTVTKANSEHVHDGVNAHAWMSVALYREQVKTIAEGLARVGASEERSASFLANAKEYDTELSELQKQQEELAQIIAGQSVVLLHDAFDYIAEDYKLDVAYCLNLDEERQVSAGEVSETLSAIKQHNVRYIFAEERYAASMCETIQKEADVTVIYLDTLNRGEYEADSYLEGMRANMEKLRGAMKEDN